jgi:hypothetical protein
MLDLFRRRQARNSYEVAVLVEGTGLSQPAHRGACHDPCMSLVAAPRQGHPPARTCEWALGEAQSLSAVAAGLPIQMIVFSWRDLSYLPLKARTKGPQNGGGRWAHLPIVAGDVRRT